MSAHTETTSKPTAPDACPMSNEHPPTRLLCTAGTHTKPNGNCFLRSDVCQESWNESCQSLVRLDIPNDRWEALQKSAHFHSLPYTYRLLHMPDGNLLQYIVRSALTELYPEFDRDRVEFVPQGQWTHKTGRRLVNQATCTYDSPFVCLQESSSLPTAEELTVLSKSTSAEPSVCSPPYSLLISAQYTEHQSGLTSCCKAALLAWPSSWPDPPHPIYEESKAILNGKDGKPIIDHGMTAGYATDLASTYLVNKFSGLLTKYNLSDQVKPVWCSPAEFTQQTGFKWPVLV